jgi:hypothetical protein
MRPLTAEVPDAVEDHKMPLASAVFYSRHSTAAKRSCPLPHGQTLPKQDVESRPARPISDRMIKHLQGNKRPARRDRRPSIADPFSAASNMRQFALKNIFPFSLDFTNEFA